MAKQNVSLSNTFNEWRLKTNTVGAWVGDADTIISTYSASYTNLQGSSPNGTGAQFDVDIDAGVYSIINIDLGGSNYLTGEKITISGSNLGGVDGVHDLVINVDSQTAGSIQTVSVFSGEASPDLVAEFNLSVDDIDALTTFAGYGTTLATASVNLATAVNELHTEVTSATSNIGTIGSLTTTATNLAGAVNELDLKQGNATLTTTATNLSGAVNELDAQIGLVTGGAKGQILFELYGTTVRNMTDHYDGVETNIVDALNTFYDYSQQVDSHEIELTSATTNIGTIGSLTTTATNLSAAVNELDLKQGNAALTTTATNLSGAVNELDAQIGPVTGGAKGQILFELYGGTAQNMTDHYTGAETNIIAALNALDTVAGYVGLPGGGVIGEIHYELHGIGRQTMDLDYVGPEDNIIDALNSIYNATDLETLDGQYLKINGSNALDANKYFTVSNFGIRSKDTEALVLATYNAANVPTARMTIADSSGNIGINKGPGTYKVDVSGSLNATTIYENANSLSAIYQTLTGTNAVTADQTHTGSNTFNPGTGKSLTFDTYVVSNDTYDFKEWIQDTIGDMVSTNTETGGISVTYNDAGGKLNFAIGDNGHSHTFANLSDGTEGVQDVVGGMVTGNTESGISVAYDDASGKLNFTVNSFNTFLVTDTDSGFTWAETGSVVVDSADDTISWVSGSGIDIDVDATNDAIRVAHSDTSTQASVNNSNGTVIQDITLDGFGHITSLDSTNLDLRYSKNTFQTFTRSATDSGYTWGTAAVVADSLTDTLTFIEGDGIDIVTDSTADAIRITVDSEWIQDTIGSMVSSNTESGGISVTYDDTGGKLNFAIGNNGHNHTFSNLSDGTEGVQDVVGGMVTGNTETGIAVTYDDTGGKLNFALGSHGHDWGDITSTSGTVTATATVQGIVGGMVNGSSETGISVTYNATTQKLDFAINNFTVTLSGAVTSPATTATALGAIGIVTTIGDNAITSTKINAGAVTNAKIGTGAVTDVKIGTGAVTNAKIGTGAVTDVKLGTGAVTTAKIANLAVTDGKIGDLAVTTGKIANLAVTNGKIADNAITNAKIADDAVSSAELKTLVTLKILNSAGTTLLTIHGAGE